MKVLAVYDDAFILELLTMIAARVGYSDIATALSGEAALDMLRDKSSMFDCLLLDINMPGMDGIELCELVRALPGYEKTPIVMLTAMAEKQFIDRAFKGFRRKFCKYLRRLSCGRDYAASAADC